MPASLDGLDRAQLSVVTHRGGPLLILGAPGSGKTHVLTRRAGWLVEEGTPAGSVLVLAPTPAAATDLRTRLETLIETPYEELSVYGAQELCERLLRDEALEAGLDPLFAPVSAADRLALLLERIDDLPLRRHEIRGNPAPLLAGFVERIDRLKEEMVRAQDFRRWAEARSATVETDDERTHAERELEFAQVYAAHDRLL
ncbi:MAG: ATP-dependent helicase UvrD/PcrA, partial [Thermoleophilaceae bacterium]|nr:ATP-dependent helicase UvrD/PcrA [Thermoleophilaceae bacterium]